MKRALTGAAFAALGLLCAAQAQAQTADEIVEKYLTAIGGRATLAKLQSRTATGTITVSMQGMDFSGPAEMYNKAPNKMRMYFRIDLSQAGAGEVAVDQRCDGKVAFVSNSMQGDRDLSGNQLQNMLNATFPTPLLNYKDSGAKIELVGKDKVGERAVYVVQYTPKSGSASKEYFDAENYQLLRTVAKVDVPEMGGEIEQTADMEDYRDVDGVKVPFKMKMTNSMQVVTLALSKVEHNKPIDDLMFSKPAK